jgi:CRISPR/Cas system-associated endonuclease Cas1
VLVDWVVLDMLKAGQLTAADYEQTGNPKQPVRLNERVIELMILQYESRINETAYHPEANGQTSYRRIVELQVRRLARLMLGQEKGYGPYLMK